MLISKTVMVRWNGLTTKWYLSKGYPKIKQNEFFECNVADLPPGSTAKVLVDCDYKKDGCKGIHQKPYRQYTEDKENGYGNCCTNKKCGAAKTKEVLLKEIGVDNIQKLDKYKNESRLRQQKPFSLFVKQAEYKGLTLLTNENEYENKKSRIKFICHEHIEHGEQETNAETFLKNKCCCNYGKGELNAETTRHDGNVVYQAFINKGVIPQFNPNDYRKNSQSLPFICPEHKQKGIQYTNYTTLMSSPHKCYYCGKQSAAEQLRHEESFIFDYFKNRELIVVDGQTYKDQNTHINFECPKHIGVIQKVTYHSLTKTRQPCELCRAEESLAKLNRRLRSSIGTWKKDSEQNSNYSCIFTGDMKYNVHHIKPFNKIIKDALLELNFPIKDKYNGEEFIVIRNKVVELHTKYPLGVCISNNIHILFHQLYGKEAEIEAFYEFEKRYKLGEFNNVLKEVG